MIDYNYEKMISIYIMLMYYYFINAINSQYISIL